MDNTTRKATDVYDEIVTALASQGTRTGIPQWVIEDRLLTELGATQQSTMDRHIELMVRGRWLTQVTEGTAYRRASYDLVAVKLKELAARAKGQEREAMTKGAERRR